MQRDDVQSGDLCAGEERLFAVGWLKHLNIALQCAGNGIDWQSGNTLRVSDSVIQGFAQYGVRAGHKTAAGYGGFEIENAYEEVGNCTNPAGNLGEAGVIAQGSAVKIDGGEAPGGGGPLFANTGPRNIAITSWPKTRRTGRRMLCMREER